MSQPSNPPQLNKGESSTGVLLQPMGFADILDAMFSIYRNHFRLFVSICGVYFLWIIGINLLTSILRVLFASVDQFHILKLAENGLILISAVVMLLVKGGLVVGSAQTFLGRRVTVSAALKQAKRRFLPYVGSNLLYGIVVGLFTVTLIGIPFALFFGFRWIFCSLAALFEEKPAVSALKRSSELSKGGWWRVFGMMIGIRLLVLFIQSVFPFILGVIYGIQGFRSLTDQVTQEDEALLEQTIQETGSLREMLAKLLKTTLVAMLVEMVAPGQTTWDGFVDAILSCISLAITCLTLPMGIIGVTLIYFDRRIRKEGFDIEVMAARELN